MGILVVFEGIDRAGKSTQVAKLTESLKSNGYTVDTFVFPSHNSTGSLLRKVLSGQESLNPEALHLLFSADRYQARDHLIDMIAENNVVILDRYYYSGLAYSLAHGVERDWCQKIDLKLLEPDCVIYLDVDPRVAAKRSDYGESVFDNIDFQSKVRLAYWEMMNQKWKKINTTKRSIEDIHAVIVEHVEKLLK